MTMTTTVTERDKKLLCLLGIFILVIAFVMFLIKPTLEAGTDLHAQIAQEQMKKNQTEQKIAKIPEYQTALSDLQSEFTEKAKSYSGVVENYDVDRMLTDLALSHGFSREDLYALNMTFPSGYATMNDYQTESGQALTGIFAVSVDFQVHGAREKIQSFLDFLINEEPSVRVSGFQWSEDPAAADQYFLMMNLQFYMVEKPNSTASE
jgi:hypothetical protein